MNKMNAIKNIVKPGFILAFILASIAAIGQIPPLDVLQEATNKPISTDFFSLRLDVFTSHFFVRMGIDLISMIVLIRFIYYRIYAQRDYFFTFFMFNLLIFIIATLLTSNSGFSIGAAFGLFAIFAMLRYRTEDISARDMTYLFISITFGLITSINMGTWIEIALINTIIIILAFLIEGNLLFKPEFVKVIDYEKIELIKPESNAELINDLKQRTGLDIHKVYVKRIDFLRDSAVLKIYYRGVDGKDE